MVSKNTGASLSKLTSASPASRSKDLLQPKPASKARPVFHPPVSKTRAPEANPAPVAKSSDLSTGKHQHRKSNSSIVVPPPQVPTQGLLVHSCFSKVGKSPDIPNKVNQDSYIIIENFAGVPNCYLFGVCDGHGHYGKEISSFIKDRFPEILSRHPGLLNNPKQALEYSFETLQSEILRNKFDTSFSGSTLIIVLMLENRVLCANVGDSRAVMGRKEPSKWIVTSLSADHKPDVEEERLRILANGGRVEAYLDEDTGEFYGPPRVWIKNLDYPGIAMSRSMGDSVAASIGVISVPDVTETILRPQDKFIVMGSDGLFEFLSNDDVLRITSGYWKKHECDKGCMALARIADERWRKNEDSIDDITCICIFIGE